MYKTLKNLALTLIMGAMLMSGAQAAIPQDNSNFTPERPGIPYVKGMTGLSYTSFNNFTNNPNITSIDDYIDYRAGDERKFLVGKYCENGDCSKDKIYYNTIPSEVKEGDYIRFSVYFHNNAEDPYDNGRRGSSENDAQGVKIGLDFSEIDYSKELIRPKGFISALNNEYRTNSKNADTVIKAYDNQDLKIATDDMQIVLANKNLKLKPVKNTQWLFVKTHDDKEFDLADQHFEKVIRENESVVFAYDTPSGDQFVNVNSESEDDKIWIEFDRVPGCFRYSGFVEFDVEVIKEEVVEPNVCIKPFSATSEDIDKTVDDKPLHKLTATEPKFSVDQDVDYNYKWISEDPNGKFYRKTWTGGYRDNFPVSKDNRITATTFNNTVYYTGNGPVNVSLIALNDDFNEISPTPDYLDTADCKASIEIKNPTPNIVTCNKIYIDHHDPILSGTVSKFKANAIDTDRKNFDEKIRYHVTQGLGLFYTKKPTNRPDNNSRYVEEILRITQNSTKNLAQHLKAAVLYELPARASNNATLNLPDNSDKTNTSPNLPEYQGGIQLLEPAPADTPTFNDTRPTFDDTRPQYAPIEYKAPEFEFPEIDLSGKNYIEVNPNQEVYFVGNRTGANAITVATGDTEGCREKFSIQDPICTYTDVDITNTVDQSSTIQEQRLIEFQAFPFNNNRDPLTAKITYSVDEGHGYFYNYRPAELEGEISPEKYSTDPTGRGQTEISVLPGATVYFFAIEEGTNIIHIDTEGSDNEKCSADYSIIDLPKIPDPLLCNDLNVAVRDYEGNMVAGGLSPLNKPLSGKLERNMVYEIKSNARYNKDQLKAETVTYSSSKGMFGDKDELIKIMKAGGMKTPTETTTITPYKIDPGKQIFSINQAKFTKPEYNKDNSTVRVNDNESVYFLAYINAETGDAFTVKADQRENGDRDCIKSFELEIPGEEPKPPVCESIEVLSEGNPLLGLNRNELYVLTASTQFSKTTTGRKVEFRSDQGYFGQSPIEQMEMMMTNWKGGIPGTGTFETITVAEGEKVFFLSYSDASGNDALTVESVGHEDECNVSFDMNPEELICQTLITTVADHENGNTVSGLLERNQIYDINSTATYTQSVDAPSSTYTADEGILIRESETQLLSLYETLQAAGGLSSTTPNTPQQGSIEVPDNETVYLFTYNDANVGPVLNIQATGRTETECSNTFSLGLAPSACQNIIVDYSPKPFEGGDTFIQITGGNFGDFNGDFKFSATYGNFHTSTHNHTFTMAEALAGVNYRDGQEGDVITIEALGSAQDNQNCRYTIHSQVSEVECVDLRITEPSGRWEEDDFDNDDEQDFRIEVTTNPANYQTDSSYFRYRWDVDDNDAGDFEDRTTSGSRYYRNTLEIDDVDDLDGVTVYAVDANNNRIPECSAAKSFHVEEYEEPEITKAVFDPNSSSSQPWRKAINIGGPDRMPTGAFVNSDFEYVTYKVEFEPGSADSAEIWDESMEYSAGRGIIPGNYVSQSYLPSRGELRLEDMIIAVVFENNDKEIIYKTDDYSVNRYKDSRHREVEVHNRDLSDYKDYNDDEDDFDDKNDRNCNRNKVCIEDFDSIFSDFRKGNENNALKIKNLDKVDTIYVLYQTRNHSEITEQKCKQLRETTGCGEEFINEINYIGYIDDDFDDEEWDDKDETTVTISCPIFLTRESGDVFFHDQLNVGIDATCSGVENTDGPIIRIRSRIEKDITSTGAGDETVIFQTPTHDVCKLSNSENVDIPEYQNVLKNFSSSICEMQTEVAEEWKETYINQAIENNIQRIARWESQTGGITDSQIQYDSSGVMVIDGDLSIDNEFQIRAHDNVPAAQTYIIRNGNLTINKNIVYDDTSANYVKPQTIPSAAFIVLNGDILVSNDVTQLDGVYMAVEGELQSKEGYPEYKNSLTVKGSLIGDITDLFTNRRSIGDARKDQGSITIRFDERIILNTPSGLNELMNVNQLRVAQ
jgi:hypothetical protein